LLHTTVTLSLRLDGPLRPPTGKGSNTSFYVFRRGGGTPFDDYFGAAGFGLPVVNPRDWT
jgi:hypothetical protein